MYPLGDFLIRIKNAYLVDKKSVTAPWSKQKEAMAKFLVKKGFLSWVKVKKVSGKSFFSLEAGLISRQGLPNLEIELFSKPGRRFYTKVKDIPYPRDERALVIISTPKGVMSGWEARKKNLGGEVVAHLY